MNRVWTALLALILVAGCKRSADLQVISVKVRTDGQICVLDNRELPCASLVDALKQGPYASGKYGVGIQPDGCGAAAEALARAVTEKLHSAGVTRTMIVGFISEPNSVCDDAAGARPTEDEIRAIEAAIELPNGSASVSAYTRHYASSNRDGHRVVHALYVLDDEPGVVITTVEELPRVLDGGCGVVTVEYDVTKRAFMQVVCNGDA